jgi:hypothetical protein
MKDYKSILSKKEKKKFRRELDIVFPGRFQAVLKGIRKLRV